MLYYQRAKTMEPLAKDLMLIALPGHENDRNWEISITQLLLENGKNV